MYASSMSKNKTIAYNGKKE